MDSSFPKISVITPSFNQGQFIEETILSVLGQAYPNLEYIIIDGESSDNTVEIIKKYSHQISYWETEKDNGQSSAINKGFARATGDIICWLNSDDLYMPGTLNYIASQLSISDDAIVFGNALHFRQSNAGLSSYGSDVVGDSERHVLENRDYIIQPSAFWTMRVWEKVGNLREDLHFSFDWEWFLRAKKMNIQLKGVKNCLSLYRIHDNHKTGTGGLKRQREILEVYSAYSNRYATLYKTIVEEDIDMSKIKPKIARFLLRTCNKSDRSVDVIKIINYMKYKSYTTNEIAGALAML